MAWHNEVEKDITKQLVEKIEKGDIDHIGIDKSESDTIELAIKAKGIVEKIEKGDVERATSGGGHVIESRPGATRNLVKAYETTHQLEPSTVRARRGRGSGSTQGNAKYNVLIVFAHWERKSFNGALLDAAINTLTEQGHEVTVSDLYGMNFNPLPSRHDITGKVDEDEEFCYISETEKAVKNGTLAADIVSEQKKVTAADLIIFQFPNHYCYMPTIMKGWLDRVLCNGFACTESKFFDAGLLKGKQAMLSFTCGSPESMNTPSGQNGDMNMLLWSIQNGILHYDGLEVLSPEIFYNIPNSKTEERQQMLEQWGERLKTIWDEEPLHFVPSSKFDKKTQQLKAEYVKECGDVAPSVGQHLGKPILTNQMLQPPVKIEENNIANGDEK